MCVYAVDYKTLEQKLTANQLGRCLQLLWLVGSFQVLMCKRGVWVGILVRGYAERAQGSERVQAKSERERDMCVDTRTHFVADACATMFSQHKFYAITLKRHERISQMSW